MSSKLSLSFIAVLALSAAPGTVAGAKPATSDPSGARPGPSTNQQINALETGDPNSVDYPNRDIPPRSPTNEQLDALETGDPNSVDYPNRDISRRSPTNNEIDASETDDPSSVDYKDRRSAAKHGTGPVSE
jgi:hypothetical protein